MELRRKDYQASVKILLLTKQSNLQISEILRGNPVFPASASCRYWKHWKHEDKYINVNTDFQLGCILLWRITKYLANTGYLMYDFQLSLMHFSSEVTM